MSYDRKVFASLFAKSAAERGEALRYPFSLRTGYMLMAVAEYFAPLVQKDAKNLWFRHENSEPRHPGPGPGAVDASAPVAPNAFRRGRVGC